MRNTEMPEQKVKYLCEQFGGESALHQKIREKSESEDVMGMQISAYEGRLVQFFSKLIRAEKIVEIGSLFGYSALWFLDSLPENGELHLLEKDDGRVSWMKDAFKDHPGFRKVQWHPGDAVENLGQLEKLGPFDLCFIDANKGAYPTYLSWAEKNIRKGGLILGDNSFLFGEVYQSNPSPSNQCKAMTEFNQRLSNTKRFNSTLIPTEEGITVAQVL